MIFGILLFSSILLGNGIYLHNTSALEEGCNYDDECNEDNNSTDQNKQSSLTIKKEIFGCEHIIRNDDFDYMSCTELNNDSDLWLACTDPRINSTEFCKNLPKNLFDIKIFDEKNNPIKQINDTSRRVTIKNIDPGTYLINQVKYLSGNYSEFEENNLVFEDCVDAGFSDGGSLYNGKEPTLYSICVEYDDEHGNDCRMTIVNSGEKKVCIVKNHIVYATW